jgi:serine/threonine-protein kinase RsbW
MTAQTRIALTIPSRLDHLDLVQAVAEEVARLAGCDESDRLDLALAVREATVNAMKHGHGFDASREVEVEFGTNGTGVKVVVRDEGPGFDPAALPDPTAPENLLRPCGRGLFLIRSLVDELKIAARRKGMELILVKHLATGRTSAAGGA